MVFKLIKIFKVVDVLFIIFAIINFIISLMYNLIIKNYEPLSVLTNVTMTFLYNLVQGVFYYLAALFIEKWCIKNEK
jgi:hypothetical protein